MEWLQANKLKLNPEKTEVILVSRRSYLGFKETPVLGMLALPLLLGPGLLLDKQAAAVAWNACYQLRLVSQLWSFMQSTLP